MKRRKIKAFFSKGRNNYKGCVRCNTKLVNSSSPPIYTYDTEDVKFTLLNGYIIMPYCGYCWHELTVQERIDGYISDMNKDQNVEFTIRNICKHSNVDPNKYLRKMKLDKINKIE